MKFIARLCVVLAFTTIMLVPPVFGFQCDPQKLNCDAGFVDGEGQVTEGWDPCGGDNHYCHWEDCGGNGLVTCCAETGYCAYCTWCAGWQFCTLVTRDCT